MHFSMPGRLPLAVLALMVALPGAAQDKTPWTLFQPILTGAADQNPEIEQLNAYAAYRLDVKAFKASLDKAPLERPFAIPAIIDLPMPDGGVSKFRVLESPILSPDLAAKIPIRTYIIQGVDDPHASGRIDFGTYGFHGAIFSPKGDVIIDPIRRSNTREYVAFYRRDHVVPRWQFTCWTDASAVPPDFGGGGIQTTGPTLKTYRLALNTTTEYTTVFGTVAAAQAAATTSVNRVTGVYEKDAAIRLNLTSLTCWTGADPYTNNDGVTMLTQNQTRCDATPGSANYDIGHVFSTGGGGVAFLACVGVAGSKAKGVTGLPTPTGDAFDIDYVAHEMGHQYGGRHSFNGTTGACGGGNRDSVSAYEPGSGSTIMGYAGICGAEDLQAHSDAYFHTKSIDEMVAWRNNASSGGTSSNTGNSAPTVNAGADTSIPQSTPFKLTATASDPNGDPLTYCWEQFNLGTASPTTNNTTRPLFRSFNPSTSATRFFPRLTDVLNNLSPTWEILPNVNRSMTFRCTVRDNRAGGGGVETDAVVLTVSGTAMAVTSPNTNVEWLSGSTQTVTWSVGGSAALSANVNIRLSTDGGNSYGTGTTTLLVANTPNDGSQAVTLPVIASNTTCRIFVESANGVFYDVSNTNFRITRPTISGTVALGDWGGPIGARPVTFEIRAVGSTIPIYSTTLNLGAGGAYAFNPVIPAAGNYDITCKGSNWLRAIRSNVAIAATGVAGQNFSLINGDANDDNTVDIADYAMLSSSYGKSLGDVGYLSGADLNGDDSVDIADYAILSSKYGQSGVD
ncbi:MAG: hypothetical protein K1X67_16560 [Fimbriimonadaceae bacterium]|nr:hypothetical protein [Fimbriimonadaceae bacterium]